MNQINLFDRKGSLQERFERFHADNPHVFTLLVRLSREWKAAGHKRCAIDVLFGRLRWDIGIKTVGDDFRVNNDFRSRYSRKIMAECPDLDGFFEVRELRAA
jgi:hypothetical protein